MKKIFFTLVVMVLAITAIGQQPKLTKRFPLGVFHQKNQIINGFSVGLYSGFDDEQRNVRTNGIKLEPIGAGIIAPLIPNSPISEKEEFYRAGMKAPLSERVNGLNISPAGTFCDCLVNGISAGGMAQLNRQVNGIAISVLGNMAEKHNGLQLGLTNENFAMNGVQIGLSNTGYRARGLQIGLINDSKNLRGVQIGLWNSNQKRKLPILNWSFSK